MKNLSKVSTPKKVLFIGLGILAVGIVVLMIGLLQSPAFWQTFQCGYDLSLKNSSLTRDQISEYCNNQILKTENVEEEEDLTTVGFGIILLIIGLIIIGIAGVWVLVRRRRERTKVSSGVGMEMMSNKHDEKEDRFIPRKVLIYCLIVGLISALLLCFHRWTKTAFYGRLCICINYNMVYVWRESS
jgi:uncharacterized membrane protein YeiB